MKKEKDRKKLKTFRIEEDVWERFTKICKAKDVTATQQIRKLIKQFVAENNQLLLLD